MVLAQQQLGLRLRAGVGRVGKHHQRLLGEPTAGFGIDADLGLGTRQRRGGIAWRAIGGAGHRQRQQAGRDDGGGRRLAMRVHGRLGGAGERGRPAIGPAMVASSPARPAPAAPARAG